jgi:hypothetical protein
MECVPFVDHFPHVSGIAELSQGREFGGAGGHPARHVVVDLVSEIRLDLSRQVRVTLLSLQES